VWRLVDDKPAWKSPTYPCVCVEILCDLGMNTPSVFLTLQPLRSVQANACTSTSAKHVGTTENGLVDAFRVNLTLDLGC
jgi:hypothetical protein